MRRTGGGQNVNETFGERAHVGVLKERLVGACDGRYALAHVGGEGGEVVVGVGTGGGCARERV